MLRDIATKTTQQRQHSPRGAASGVTEP